VATQSLQNYSPSNLATHFRRQFTQDPRFDHLIKFLVQKEAAEEGFGGLQDENELERLR